MSGHVKSQTRILPPPWIDGGPVRSLPVLTQQMLRLKFSMHIGSLDRSDQNVIGQCVAPMAASTEATGEAVVAKAVHHDSANARVCANQKNTHSQSGGHPY